MLSNNFYIYRHIRPDTNEVFYIGKGNNLDKRVSLYSRAKCKNRRHDYWKRIVAKNNGVFTIEIMFECETEEQVNAKEIEFIALYGRKDLGNGTLVNFTDGGEGAKGVVMTDEVKRKHSVSMQGKNWQSKKVIDAVSKKVYSTVKDAEKSLGMKKGLLGKYLNGQNSNVTSLIYLDIYNNVSKESIDKLIFQSKKTSMDGKNHSIESRQKMSENSINKGGRKVVDIVENIEYPTASEASRVYGINISTLIGKLNGRRTNNTNLRYADGL
jgi:hypothetical protein